MHLIARLVTNTATSAFIHPHLLQCTYQPVFFHLKFINLTLASDKYAKGDV